MTNERTPLTSVKWPIFVRILVVSLGDSKDEWQMLVKMTARAGEYAFCVRYKCAGIGVDTDKWKLVLDDEEERIRRHRAVLAALEDSLLSPQGALTATMLPHLTDLQGVIALRTTTGRAPLYSALQPDFIERLTQLADDATLVVPFETINTFHKHMQTLRTGSTPALPVRLQQQRGR